MDIIKEEIGRQKSYRIATKIGWYVSTDIILGTYICDENSNRIKRIPSTMVSGWVECQRLLKDIETLEPLEYFMPNLYNVENIELSWLVFRWASHRHSYEILDEFANNGYPIYHLSISAFVEKMLDRILELEHI